MANEQNAMSQGGCGCSSRSDGGAQTPAGNSGCCGGGRGGAHDHPASLRRPGRYLPFLLGRLPDQVRRRSRTIPREGRHQAQARRCAGRHRLHLPDAPADPPDRPGILPDLRNGVGAGVGQPGRPTQSRTGRHDAPFLGRARVRSAGRRFRDGRPSDRRPRLDRPEPLELDPVRLRHAGRALGRMAVLRARLAVAGHTKSEHVHLIAMGVGGAFTYSTAATVAPGVFPPAFRTHEGAVSVYFEAAAVIAVLVLLGQVLELRAREATSGAIKALLDLAPKTARLVDEAGADQEVSLAGLNVGQAAGPAERESAGGRPHPVRRTLVARRVAGDRRNLVPGELA